MNLKIQLPFRSLNCEDIDECARNNGKGECDYACVNSVGSFRCSCAAGFHLDADGLTCHDINECQANNGNCSQKCINTQGDHLCSCFEGFVSLVLILFFFSCIFLFLPGYL